MTAVARVPDYRAVQEARNGNCVFGGSGPEIPEKISAVIAAQNSNVVDPLRSPSGTMHRKLNDETNVESNTTIPSLGHMELKPNKLKSTWTRLNRMHVGPLVSAEIVLKSTTGKRGLEDVLNPNCIKEADSTYRKHSEGNREDGRVDNTSAGVDDHPCREQ